MNSLHETKQRSRGEAMVDGRPRFAIGHVSLAGSDITALASFYEAIGMRVVVATGHFAILELRGGTHIVISDGAPGRSTLDFIVDDIDDTHALLADQGANPGTIVRGHPHDRFEAADPEGNRLIVNSTHAIGLV